MTSASITAWARMRTPLAQEIDITIGHQLAHRFEHGHPVLGHGVHICIVGSHSNDARMTRWPLSFTAGPLLHQVWGLNPSRRDHIRWRSPPLT